MSDLILEPINEEYVFEFIVSLMNQVEKRTGMNTGQKKKRWVMDQLRFRLGNEVFDRYEPVFNMMIDGLVKISRKDIKLMINHVSMLSKFCCS